MAKKLQLKFDPNQDYQLAAIASVVNLFQGLPEASQKFMLGDETVSNLPPGEVLYDSWLLDRLRDVRRANAFAEDVINLEKEDGFELEGISNNSPEPFPYFTVEMETGTGKTYVYLRTIYELRKHYGFSKFIIVVPSIAIYEGVIKTEEITREHFRSLYDNEPVTLIPYDGSRLSRVRIFATSTQTQILVMTIDAFNSKTNNLYKASEKLPGERLAYQYIQEARPIIILDEPQSIDTTEKARSAIRTLHPLFGLRYSATHRTSPNLVYRLTPVEAYRQNLVKKIEVIGLETHDNLNEKFLALESISARTPITAKVKTYTQEHGIAREAEVSLKHGDDLFKKTKRDEHNDGYVVEEINAADKFVQFKNGVRLDLNGTLAPSRPQVFDAQITATIKQHMETQQLLKPLGLKVLSLFFIDRVANYTLEQGIIRKIFDASFEKLKKQYPEFKRYGAEEVRDAYFAKSKPKKDAEEVAIDTQGRNAAEREAEKRAFALIMRNKEQLLSFDEPVSFIFAHSALREGWDNPNVFQICTLNQTVSEIKKRQEIGRGLRLAVNQEGERVSDTDVNVLTVIANESYESYAARLQQEYVEDGNEAPPQPKRPQDAWTRRNPRVFGSDEFREFWQKLNRESTYQINIDTATLIEECVALLSKASFPESVVVLTRGRFVVTEFTIRLDSASNGKARITLEIHDTDDNREIRPRVPIEAKVDLAKFRNDDRLRGFKVLEIVGEGDNAVVRFNNGEELTRYQPISFKTEKSQRAAEKPDEVLEIEGVYPVFNFIARAAKETSLTRPTLNKIFQGLPETIKNLLFQNPEGFTAVFITVIREAIADHIASRIEFTLPKGKPPHDAEALFPPEKKFPQKELIDAGVRGLYSKVQWDSFVELNFVEKVLKREEDKVIFYFKFPPTFKIGLPKVIGNYNPDWGIVRKSDDGTLKLELVRETKGTDDLAKLRFTNEGRKVICASKHFKQLGIDYRAIKWDQQRWWAAAENVAGTLLQDVAAEGPEPIVVGATSPSRVLHVISLEDSRVAKERFKTLLPLYSLKAAAGYFGNGEAVEPEGWVDALSVGHLDDKMFVARAVGRSMEPSIHDGDYCVFRAKPQGTRQGKIVLAQSRGISDPETGGSFTLKRYRSEKTSDQSGEWKHTQITLEPLNPDYDPIILTPESEGDVDVVAEYITTLGKV
jgi:type III restriction enzyme